jgi:uncharacterized protein YjbI with pentapeptide repeats
VAPGLLMVAGAVVALWAVVQASSAVLVVAGLLLAAGIVITIVRARRRLERSGQKIAVVAGVVALGAAIFVPASQNVDRCARLGRDAALSGCDLSDRDLTAEDLHGADLSHADLRGTDLTRVDLVTANLRGADLRGADLAEARMTRATMTNADLRDATLADTELTDSDLTDATVRGAAFPNAELTGAVLAGLDLTDADLTGARLDHADLSGANLSGSRLGGANLTEANLSDADLSGADLGEVEETTQISTPALLDGADLRGANLSGADLTDVAAPNANFEGADFTETRLQGNNLVGTVGITGDDFVAAFGVPPGQLAGETARHGIVLHPYEEIVEAVTPAGTGQAVPDVQPYVANSAFHPAIVLDPVAPPGPPLWASGFRDLWAPTAIRYAELVVVQSDGRETVETCQYTYVDSGLPAPPITRYVPTVTIRVFSAHSAGLVAERTFRGGEPGPCPAFESNILVGEILGGPPNITAEARPWLEGLINPLPNRPPPLPPIPLPIPPTSS